LQTQNPNLYDQNVLAYGKQLYDYAQFTAAFFDGCARLTNAIDYVTSKQVSTIKIFGSKDAMDASLKTYLIGGGYYFEEIASPLDIGNDCDLLLLHTPKTDITEEEAGALSNYLAGGGKVFLITSCIYPDMPNLHSVTQEFGLDVLDTKNIVCEQDTQYLFSKDRPYYFLAHVAPSEITKNFDGHFAVITAHAIKIADTLPEGISALTPLRISGASFSYLNHNAFRESAVFLISIPVFSQIISFISGSFLNSPLSHVLPSLTVRGQSPLPFVL
jgi:hypothetical protein